jgi:transcriptional regulator with XRE-family HTH domain
MEKETILEKIREVRKAKNISQQEMSEKLGISRSQYSSLENGNSEISLEKFLKICSILELKMYDFENQLDKQNIKDIMKNELTNILKKLQDL